MKVHAIAGLALIVAAPALAQSAPAAAECQVQAQLVQSVVDMRAEGTGKSTLVRQVKKTLGASEATEKYQEVVGPIVDWVFTLPQEQLTADVGPAFNEMCLAQQGG